MLTAALGSNQVSGAQGSANLCKRTFLDSVQFSLVLPGLGMHRNVSG